MTLRPYLKKKIYLTTI